MSSTDGKTPEAPSQANVDVTLTRGQVSTLIQVIRSYEIRGTKDQVQAIARVFTEVEVVLAEALNPSKKTDPVVAAEASEPTDPPAEASAEASAEA